MDDLVAYSITMLIKSMGMLSAMQIYGCHLYVQKQVQVPQERTTGQQALRHGRALACYCKIKHET